MYSGPNMGGVESQTLEHVCNKTGSTRHAILIDPADQTPDTAAKERSPRLLRAAK